MAIRGLVITKSIDYWTVAPEPVIEPIPVRFQPEPVDYPPPGAEISDLIGVSGWAYNEDIGVDEIRLILDGQTLATARYGVSRSDVVEAMGVMTDPNAPNLGFELELDSRNWTNGTHELAIEILNQQGITLRYGDRIVTVSN